MVIAPGKSSQGGSMRMIALGVRGLIVCCASLYAQQRTIYGPGVNATTQGNEQNNQSWINQQSQPGVNMASIMAPATSFCFCTTQKLLMAIMESISMTY